MLNIAYLNGRRNKYSFISIFKFNSLIALSKQFPCELPLMWYHKNNFDDNDSMKILRFKIYNAIKSMVYHKKIYSQNIQIHRFREYVLEKTQIKQYYQMIKIISSRHFSMVKKLMQCQLSVAVHLKWPINKVLFPYGFGNKTYYTIKGIKITFFAIRENSYLIKSLICPNSIIKRFY